MASVYQRGRVWWGRWGCAGKTVRKPLSTARNRDEALALAREREAAAKGDATAAGGWTVGRVFREWLSAVEVKHNAKPETVRGYRSSLGSLPKRWHAMRADNFPTAEIRAFQREQHESGIAPRTINIRLERFIAALRWAASDTASGIRKAPEFRKRGGNPLGASVVERLKVPKSDKPKALEQPQLQALLTRVLDTELEAPIRIALWTGLRRGELCRLRWDTDVDIVRGVVCIQARGATIDPNRRGAKHRSAAWSPKTYESSRTISLPPEALAWLKAHRARQKLDGWPAGRGDPVCLSSHGRSWSIATLGRHVAGVFTELGISCDEEHTLHMLRSTFALEFLRCGGHIESLRKILGHSTIATTGIYLRETDEGAARDMLKMRPLPLPRRAS